MRVRSILIGVAASCLLGALAACGGNGAVAGGDAASHDGGGLADSSVLASPETSVPMDGSSSTSTDGPVGAGGDASADAPASDASGGRDFSTNRGLFLGASRCAQAGVQLCEDFESGAINKSVWSVSGTAPVVDGIQHARGTKALHITQKGNGLSYIKETMTFPEANDTYFGRAFFYFNSLPGPPMTYAHWTIIAASGTGVSGEIRVSGQFQNGKNLFGVGTDNSVDPMGTGDWTNSDNDPKGMPSAVPMQQWVCIEWMHKGDTNETRFWWDATEHPSLYTSSSMHGGNPTPYLLPQFTNVWIGWQEYQTSTETFELWVDEIAIDKARIGCVL
jgi:hypothetical protein